MLEKLRNIYDLILDLESSIPVGARKSATTPDQPEITENRQEPGAKTVNMVNPEIKTSEIQENDVSERSALKKEIMQEATKKAISEKETRFVSDRFKGSKQTVHEEMAGKTRPDDISSQYKTKPINNIMGAIALNDRFELINHLFNGDKTKFEQTIENLNVAASFVDAYNYLQENFEWDMDNEYVQRLLELIRRKLIVHRNES